MQTSERRGGEIGESTMQCVGSKGYHMGLWLEYRSLSRLFISLSSISQASPGIDGSIEESHSRVCK